MGYFDSHVKIQRSNNYDGVIRGLWMTPIAEFICTLPNLDEIIKTIKNLAYEQKNNSKNLIETDVSFKIKKKLYESSFDFLKGKNVTNENDRNNLLEIENWFKLCIKDYYKLFFDKNDDESKNIRIKESWVHITNDNGYHGPHMHPNCSVCGNFYIEIGESNVSEMNGVNCFYSPVSSDMAIDGYDYYNTAETIIPQNFKLMLFPPKILHSATPYSGKKDRIVLAFNSLYGNAGIDYIA